MILRTIEMLKGALADDIIEKMILGMNNIYNIDDEKATDYIKLLECYSKCDIENMI